MKIHSPLKSQIKFFSAMYFPRWIKLCMSEHCHKDTDQSVIVDNSNIGNHLVVTLFTMKTF